MSDHQKSPIGVFDSGLGGLTVVKELMRQLPQENIVYYGDTARVPYGTKSKESIIGFSKENTKILLQYKVRIVVESRPPDRSTIAFLKFIMTASLVTRR